MTIRPMGVADIAAGLHLCRLSGWNQLEEDWRSFLDSPQGGGRLAEVDDAVAGSVAFLRYGRCFSWLSMMLVDPAHRRSGVGTRLMEAALEALAEERCVRLDATPLGEPLYRRFGFEPEYELVRAAAVVVARFDPAPPDARPIQPADFADVFASDRRVFGADRSALLASFYRRAPELAWTVRRGGAIAGHCVGRPGFRYKQIGPVVAEDEAVARDLVSCCLAGQLGQQVAIDVPRRAGEWMAWLESVGFTIERPFVRMRRGENDCRGIVDREFAIAGPEFG